MQASVCVFWKFYFIWTKGSVHSRSYRIALRLFYDTPKKQFLILCFPLCAMRPKITNTLKGALGETYYKELCSQKGWAYCSLETIHTCKDLGSVIFKMGFDRIRVSIPESIRPEVVRIAKPSNRDAHNPSFVFDYLAYKAGEADTSKIQHPKKADFCWAEVKTGLGIFSDSQYRTLSEIRLPIAVFHIDDVLAKPQYIEMDWDIMSGKEFARTLVDVNKEEDYDVYEDYRSSDRHNASRTNYGGYGSNYNSQRGGLVARFSSTCRACRRKITAGKDRVKQDNYGNWVHVRCASRNF